MMALCLKKHHTYTYTFTVFRLYKYEIIISTKGDTIYWVSNKRLSAGTKMVGREIVSFSEESFENHFVPVNL